MSKNLFIILQPFIWVYWKIQMGNFCEFEETLPPEIMTMTKDTRKLKFEILYCEG